MRLWYLSNRRPAKDQATLRIRAVSPEPSLFAHMNYGGRRRVRPKSRHLAPLYGCACVFEERIYGGQKVPKSHELAHISIEDNLTTVENARGKQKRNLASAYLHLQINMKLWHLKVHI